MGDDSKKFGVWDIDTHSKSGLRPLLLGSLVPTTELFLSRSCPKPESS